MNKLEEGVLKFFKMFLRESTNMNYKTSLYGKDISYKKYITESTILLHVVLQFCFILYKESSYSMSSLLVG